TQLAPLDPAFVSVTYGAGGSTRERTHATVARLVRETALVPAAHPTCVGASRAEIDEIADRFGAQVIVLSLDVKRAASTPSGFVVTTHGGRTETTLDALDWAREAVERGAGELLVN
ncbi:HisA/HisF-related TIM barrel protein, partial [Staphylococcus aureus]